MKLKFGDKIETTYAGDDNPHKFAYFVEYKRRIGKVNPGVHIRATDKKGNFWETHKDVIIKCDGQSAEDDKKVKESESCFYDDNLVCVLDYQCHGCEHNTTGR